MSDPRRPARLGQTTLGVVLVAAVALSLSAAGVFISGPSDAGGDGPLAAAWDRAEAAGSYHFESDVVQMSTPAAIVSNAGRQSTSQTMYMEGDTDLDASAMELRLSGAAGATSNAETVGLRLVDGITSRRVGAKEWEVSGGATDTVVPAGDFLAYLDAARDVTEVGTESRLGSTFTRYTFRIDGPAFAAGAISQMQRSGELPAGARATLPAMYNALEGDGELWVAADGLPVRQSMSLRFPQDSGDLISADITIDFSEFGTATVDGVERAAGAGWSPVDFATQHRESLALLAGAIAVLLALFAAWHHFGFVPLSKRRVSLLLAVGLVAGQLVAGSTSAAGAPSATSDPSAANIGADREVAEQQQVADALQELAEQQAADLADPHEDRLAGLVPAGVALPAQAADPADSGADADGDGITDFVELSIGTDPLLPDTDDDGLTDFVEWSIGTDPTFADSDGDTISDFDEVDGFRVDGEVCPGKWYGDPNAFDSNDDGISDAVEWQLDTDDDCTPDMFSHDNDGDGVPDGLDLAPFTNGTTKYSKDTALDLELAGLTTDEDLPVFVDFQIRPTDLDQLQFATTDSVTGASIRQLDWPADDRGQIRDVNDGGPTDNDVSLIPLLEIAVPAGHALPDEADLIPYGINTGEPDDSGTRLAYVQLNLVTDPDTGTKVAFSGRMRYLSSSPWARSQQVRLVWMVQVENDIECSPDIEEGAKGYVANCSAVEIDGQPAGYVYDVPQVVQSYYEGWTLTGVSVTEEHGADIAIIYEDPTDDSDLDDDGPSVGLGEVLSERFLAAKPGSDAPEITTANIAAMLDRDLISGAVGPYGLANVFQVDVASEDTFDAATHKANSSRIPDVLGRFSGYATRPLLTTAYTTESRSINLDMGAGFASLSANALTLDFQNRDLAPIQSLSGLRWTPFCDGAGVRVACSLDEFWQDLETRHAGSYDPNDPSVTFDGTGGLDADVLRGQNILMNLHAATLYNGITAPTGLITESGAAPVGADGAAPGVLVSESADAVIADLATAAGEKSIKSFAASKWLKKFTARGKTSQGALALLGNDALTKADAAEVARPKGGTRTAAAANFALNVGVYVAVAALDDAGGDAAKVGAVLSFAVTVKSTIETVKLVAQASKRTSLANVLLGSADKISKGVVKASIITAAVTGVVTWGLFFAQVDSAGVTAFGSQFNAALAGVIAETLYLAFTTALAFTGLGIVIVLAIEAFDAIFSLVCALGEIADCFSLSATITKGITYAIFGTDPMVDVGADDLVVTDAPEITLHDPSTGYRKGNKVDVAVKVTTTIRHVAPDAWQMLPYMAFYSEGNIRSGDFRHELSTPGGIDLTPTGPGPWVIGTGPTHWSKQLYTGTRQRSVMLPEPFAFTKAGLNQSFTYSLNSEYSLPSYECWSIPSLPFGYPLIPVCFMREIEGNTSSAYAPLVYDILPDTLSAFIETVDAPNNRLALAWDTGFRPLLDGDGDGQLATVDGGLDTNDRNPDTDGDGLTDHREFELREDGIAVSPSAKDIDGDCLTDLDEVRLGTNPNLADTDNDGLPDGVEARHLVFDVECEQRNGQLVVGNSGGWEVTVVDPGGDLADNLAIRVYSDPTVPDTDGDGISDGAEKQLSELDGPVEFRDGDGNACTEGTAGCVKYDPRADDRGVPYHPTVVNSPPISITMTSGSTGEFLKPGDTAVINTDVTTTTPLDDGSVVDITLPAHPTQSLAPAVLDFSTSQTDSRTSSFTVPGGVPTVEIAAGVRAWTEDPDNVPAPYLDAQHGTIAASKDSQRLDIAARGSAATDAFSIAENSDVGGVWFDPLPQDVRVFDPVTAAEAILDSPYDVEPVEPRRPDIARLGVGSTPSIACTDDGTCMTVWSDYDNCATLTVTKARPAYHNDPGEADGIEPAFYLNRVPTATSAAGTLDPNDLELLWDAGDVDNGGPNWMNPDWRGATLDGTAIHAAGFPFSTPFCGDTEIHVREVDGGSGSDRSDDDIMYNAYPTVAFTISPEMALAEEFVPFGQLGTQAQVNFYISIDGGTQRTRVQRALTGPDGNKITEPLASSLLSDEPRQAVVASDGNGFIVATAKLDGSGAELALYDAGSIWLGDLEDPGSWGANIDLHRIGDRYIVTYSNAAGQIVAEDVSSGTVSVLRTGLPGGEYDLAVNPNDGSAVLLYIDPTDRYTIRGARWSDVASVWSCVPDCLASAEPDTDQLIALGADDPNVEFNPITGGWAVTFNKDLETWFLDYGASLFGFADRFDTDPTPVAPGMALACPAWSSAPVVDLRFEDRPGATSFVDGSGYGRDAVFESGRSPDAGMPPAVVVNDEDIEIEVAERSRFAVGFNDPTDVLAVPNPLAPSARPAADDLSIAFWYQSDPTNTTQPFTIASSVESPGQAQFELTIDHLGVVELAFGGATVSTAGGQVNDGNWHFIVATLSGDGLLQLHVDDQPPSSQVQAGAGPADGAAIEVRAGSSPVSIDQLQFYNTVLNTTAIAAIRERTAPFCVAAAGSDPGGATEWWKLNFVDPETRGSSITASASLTLRVDATDPTSTATVPSMPIRGDEEDGPPPIYVLSGEASDGPEGSGIAQVEVSTDGGTTWKVAEGTEAWAFHIIPVDSGTYQITTRATDSAGNEGAPSAAQVLVVDRDAPVVTLAPMLAAVAPTTNATTGLLDVALTGTATDAPSGIADDGVEVQITAGNAAPDPSSWQAATLAGDSWSIDYSFPETVADVSGTYTVRVRASDVAGNRSPDDASTADVLLDSTAPAVALSAASRALTVVAGDIELDGTVTDIDGSGVAAVELSFTPLVALVAAPEDPSIRTWRATTLAQRGVDVTDTSWNLTVPAALEGYFQIDLRATDVLGNELITENVWTGVVDTRAPRLRFSAEPDGAVSPDGSRFRARFECGAEDLFLSERTFTCPGQTAQPSVRNFLEDGDLRTALQNLFPDQTIVTELVNSYSKWQRTGSRSAEVAACDLFGNCAEKFVTVTDAPPAARALGAEPNRAAALEAGTVLGAAVMSPTPGQHLAVSGSVDVMMSAAAASSIKTITLSLDGTSVATRTFARSATDNYQEVIAITIATGGLHTVSISVEDWTGAVANSSTVEFFADTEAPTVTLETTDIGLDGTWAVGTDVLRFGGAVSDDETIAAVQIKINDQPWRSATFSDPASAADAASWTTAVPVPDADGSSASVQVRAIDLAGRVTTIVGTSDVDLAPPAASPAAPQYVRPDTAIEAGPAPSSVSTSATFDFTAVVGTNALSGFACRLDGRPPVSCGSVSSLDPLAAARHTFEGLAAGEHTVIVSAIDESGYKDLSPSSWSWTVVAAGPQATMTARPDSRTDQRTADFVFSAAAGSTFECSLDDAEFAPCASPQSFKDLIDGTHTFMVRTTLGAVTGTAAAIVWEVVNETPIVRDQEIVVSADDPVGRPLTLEADDVDEVVYRIVDQPRHGFLEGTAPDLSYVPFTDFAGADAFTFVADDGESVSAVGTVNVLVTTTGGLPPEIEVPGAVVSANTDPGQPFATVTYVATATDPDAATAAAALTTDAAAELRVAVDVGCIPASGSRFAIGDTTVTCSATDGNANTATASFVVRVTDNENPVVAAAKDTTIYVTLRQATTVDFALPTATDNSGTATVTCNPASGSRFEIGKTTVNCTAADASGNRVATSFVVTLDTSRLPDTGNNSLPVREALLLIAAGFVLLLIARRRRSQLGSMSAG